MSKETNDKEVLQWHPAFYASLQIEFAEEADKLIFENEHQLGTKPKEIDVLIIKKNSSDRIQKNLGRIFRKHNIVEYKSPKDYLSVDDFYKVYGYACFYKADTSKENQISIEDITITFVCHKYPRKMIKHLKEVQKLNIVKQENGIYYIYNNIIPIQLIITSGLTDEMNLWLGNLTDGLREKYIVDRLVKEFAPHQRENNYKSVMDAIVRANREVFTEVGIVCDALQEIIEEIAEQRAEERVERKLAERLEKEVTERAEKLVEERVEKLAEERAEKLVEERAEKLAEERAEKLAEERAEKLAVNKICSLVRRGSLKIEDAADELGITPEEMEVKMKTVENLTC